MNLQEYHKVAKEITPLSANLLRYTFNVMMVALLINAYIINFNWYYSVIAFLVTSFIMDVFKISSIVGRICRGEGTIKFIVLYIGLAISYPFIWLIAFLKTIIN